MDSRKKEGRLLDRRHTPRSQDNLYRLIVAVNLIGWAVLVMALILFHFARPEFVSGLQSYWGMEGRTEWSPGYTETLFRLLQLCLGLSLVAMVLRARRTRRRADNYGINLFILAAITTISLLTLKAAGA